MVKLKKRYHSAKGMADLTQTYAIEEAINVLFKMPAAKFDETVELSVHLGVDPRQSDQMVRGIVNLPHGSGKKVTVIAFTENPQQALEAGADHAELDGLIKKIEEGWLDFDVALATPTAMKQVRSIARILGPHGLMPNPKSGTVTDDITAMVKGIKEGGRAEYKMDKTGNIGLVVGKRSFSPTQLVENINCVIESIGRARPHGCKGNYILSITISTTMSPGVKLDSAVYSQF